MHILKEKLSSKFLVFLIIIFSLEIVFTLTSFFLNRIRQIERRSGKSIGQFHQDYLDMIVSDESDRSLEIITPWQDEYHRLRQDMTIETIIASTSLLFEEVTMVSDIYVPQSRLWIGDYPYVQKSFFYQIANECQRFITPLPADKEDEEEENATTGNLQQQDTLIDPYRKVDNELDESDYDYFIDSKTKKRK
jgi:hypothetical protein